MKILFLTQVLPFPLDAGAKTRAHYVLRHLSQKHEVTLVSYTRPTDEPAHISQLGKFIARVETVPIKRSRLREFGSLMRSAASGRPQLIARDIQSAMTQTVREIAAREPFDAIHADQIAMAYHALDAAKASAKRPRVILDAHNVYYNIPQQLARLARNPLRRWFFNREGRLFERYEADTCRQFDHVVTVTANDAAQLRQLLKRDGAASAPRVHVLPICIDPSLPAIERAPDARGILIIGGMHWPPNADAALWFAREVFPRVRESSPDARLWIVGARPPRELRALGDYAGVVLPSQAGKAPIVVTGHVDNPASFIEASAAMAVPLRSGSGMRVKILDALSWGLPVVTTSAGGEGIELANERTALIADSASSFAAALGRLLRDRSLSEQIAANGLRLAAQRYDWRIRYEALDEIYPSA